jgi:hypothetical protein
MAIKRFLTRICNKTDSIAAYMPSRNALVPLKGEIVIGYKTVNGNAVLSNTSSCPYIMKVGDGTHNWSELPAIGPCLFNGAAALTTNPAGDDNQVINVAIPTDTKTYSRYEFSDNSDDTSFTLAVTGYPYMLTEHCILFDNSQCAYDRWFAGISIQGINDSNIHAQRDWVSAYDITEVKISFYMIDGVMHATVTCTAGIANGGSREMQ